MEKVGITEKTVLVLGAGASMPFGFPSGRKLKKYICEGPEVFGYNSLLTTIRWEKVGDPFNPIGDVDIATSQLQIRRNREEDANKFRERWRSFNRALARSGQPSVDAFLEGQPDFVDIGKLAIAGVLLECEETKRMFEDMIKEEKNNWYESLFEKLNEGGTLERFGQNKLGIVTFNYDRSLEHYLFTALQNSYGKTDEECAEAVGKIPIIHVYGSLGALPWQDKDNNTPYGLRENQPIRPEDIVKASKTITIIRDDNYLKEFERAWELMNDARSVYFLGFGYDRTNVDRLKLPSLDYKTDKFGGTCMGLSLETRHRMKVLQSNTPQGPYPLICQPSWKDVDVYDFLHDHIILG